jgi:hypothetical protein
MRVSVVALLVLVAVVLPGCSAPVNTVESTPSAALVSLDDQGRGQLQGVSVTPSGPFGLAPGTPEDEAQSQYGNRVEVGIFDSLEGVETKLVVPMWYGGEATYQLTTPSGDNPIGDQVPLVEAAADEGGVVWWAGPNASITYHLEDGFFVLDSLVAPASH